MAIRDIIDRKDEEIRDLVLRLSWAMARYDREDKTASLEIMWLIDPFAVPSALEGGVGVSGGETTYTRRVSLGMTTFEELERDVLESAWILGSPDVARTEDEGGVRWAFHPTGEPREPKKIDPYPPRGAGSRLEVSFGEAQ